MNDVLLSFNSYEEKPFGYIFVKYPVGSTLTCSKGTTALRAENTSDKWVFPVPEAGTWTVTATDGTKTKSQSVSITKEGQVEAVELVYRYYLFDNGSKVTWQSDASPNSSASVGTTLKCIRTDSVNDYASVFTAQTVDVTKYSTLGINVSAVSGQYLLFGLGSEDMATKISTKSISSTGVHSLDISNITGKFRVAVAADYLETQAAAGSVEATQVWLE